MVDLETNHMLDAIEVQHHLLVLVNGLKHVKNAHVVAPGTRGEANVSLAVVELVPSRLFLALQVIEKKTGVKRVGIVP